MLVFSAAFVTVYLRSEPLVAKAAFTTGFVAAGRSTGRLTTIVDAAAGLFCVFVLGLAAGVGKTSAALRAAVANAGSTE